MWDIINFFTKKDPLNHEKKKEKKRKKTKKKEETANTLS
jgi:hypothetical protein